MKKLVLTSVLAVFAVSAANAANVINGDPLYRPGEGHFYSVTDLSSHTLSQKHDGENNINTWVLAEDFGYGITDKLSVSLETELTTNDTFEHNSWDIAGASLNYRVLDDKNWKLDVYGAYGVMGVWGDHAEFLAKEDTGYGWIAGVRGGYTTGEWTVAGHVEFAYLGDESFNWNDEGLHKISVGVDGLYSLCDKLSLVAGVEYTGTLDDKIGGVKVKNYGEWTGKIGANYNIDETKFVGAYVSADMDHNQGDEHDEWGVLDGFGFGVKFGIDF